MSKSSDILKELKEKLEREKAKNDFMQTLPEYKEFLKFREDNRAFENFIKNKRVDKFISFLEGLIEDEDKMDSFIHRVVKMEKRISDIQFEKGYIGGISNVMCFVLDVIESKYPSANFHKDFGDGGRLVGNYIFERWYGQGERGWSVYKITRMA